MKLTIVQAANKKQKPDENYLGFGQQFTDHMFTMDYVEGKGWHNAKICPFKNFSMSPAAMVLHYGQAIFEGLKAYKSAEDETLLFRPWDNFTRLNNSAKRMCIPMIDEEFALESLYELLRMEEEWIPGAPGTSLYIRPAVIAVDPFLGVRAGKQYLFFIILCPVGAYYKAGLKPLKIYVENEYVRAVKGGVGFAKTEGNYAASLLSCHLAHQKGFDQVLWLDGVHRKYVEEVGSSNIFFKINGELVTPQLEGSILPGITRDSVIKIAKDEMGVNVREEHISIDDVWAEHRAGRLEEVFGTGTAAVISPIGELSYKGNTIHVNDGKMGALSSEIYHLLTGIQYGTIKDKFGWIAKVK